MIPYTGIRDSAFVEKLQSDDDFDDHDDHADVPATIELDTFKGFENDGNINFDNTNVTD